MSRLATIELFKENMQFSAGHFTIFSNTDRENLHGHNYTVQAYFITEIEAIGLTFDYHFYEEKIVRLCQGLDKIFILPGNCPYLTLEEKGNYYHVAFNSEVMIFLKRDVRILPIANVSVEELSNWFVQQICLEKQELASNKISALTIKVFSAPGQGGSTAWSSSNG